jgi:hypothetical protein
MQDPNLLLSLQQQQLWGMVLHCAALVFGGSNCHRGGTATCCLISGCTCVAARSATTRRSSHVHRTSYDIGMQPIILLVLRHSVSRAVHVQQGERLQQSLALEPVGRLKFDGSL